MVPLQQAADCFLASATFFSAPMRLAVLGNVVFANHRRRSNLQKRLEHPILKLNGFGTPYCQIKWIFRSIMAPIKPLISLKWNSHSKMAPDIDALA
jgi:hypothetical protein